MAIRAPDGAKNIRKTLDKPKKRTKKEKKRSTSASQVQIIHHHLDVWMVRSRYGQWRMSWQHGRSVTVGKTHPPHICGRQSSSFMIVIIIAIVIIVMIVIIKVINSIFTIRGREWITYSRILGAGLSKLLEYYMMGGGLYWHFFSTNFLHHSFLQLNISNILHLVTIKNIIYINHLNFFSPIFWQDINFHFVRKMKTRVRVIKHFVSMGVIFVIHNFTV